jgi:predicted ATPase/class 3 adenylate cyclase
VPEEFPFCPYCRAALAPEAALREERKVVTVVFCDLVGSTARAERLDPEDVRALLSRYHARVREQLERFGGTVEKFIGDAVMALFGAPVAHEDDPERAVRAALAIRDWVAEEADVHVRIGVNTGEALVALDARPLEGEGMASGDVVNTAARLQSAAPVDGILVGEQAYRATERVIEYRPAEPVVAKGKARPVAAWEAVEARSRFGVDVTRAPRTPLVGRSREVAQLAAALERVAAERVPQLVTLVGVPGIGKSRLLAELFQAVERGDRLVTWRQGRSLPYGDGVSFWAVGEMVKSQAGILETDPRDDAEAKLAGAVARLLPDEAEARWVVSHVRPLVGLADSGGGASDRRDEAFAAWRRLFEGLAEQRPLVLVFEDLHWADDGLLDFVDQLADRLADVPALIVTTARPELLARRPAWGGGKPNALTLSLPPLSDEDTARLVHALLDRAVLRADMQAALLERAGGNPLYAEEFVRIVSERGAEELELPESVQGIVAARLDALEPGDKELLQDAAVVGKVFWSGALAAIAGRDRFEVEERLQGLERRELVRRERRSSVGGESEYAFRHALVRDVAYGTIPRAARAESHRRAAAWIDGLGRPDDHADLLVHHYRAALDLARAAGVGADGLEQAAAAALVRSADRASRLNSFAAAARSYEEALALGVRDEQVPAVLFRLAVALHLGADERRTAALERARDALLAAGDVEAAADACAVLGEALFYEGRPDAWQAALDQAQELVRGRAASPAVARVLAQIARHAMLADRNEEAVRLGEEALAVATQLGLDAVRAQLLTTIGTARGRFDPAAGDAELEQAIELALSLNDPEAARAYNNLAVLHYERGDLAAEHRLVHEALQAADRLGAPNLSRYARGNLVYTSWARGRWDDALARAEAFIADCAAGSPHVLEVVVQHTFGAIHLARDDTASAERAAARSRALAASHSRRDARVLTFAADVAWELGRREEARALLADALGDAAPFDGAPLVHVALVARRVGLGEPEALVSPERDNPWARAALLLAKGDHHHAAAVLDETGHRSLAAEVRLRGAAELAERRRLAADDEDLARAVAFYRSVGATRYLREAETLVALPA